MLGSCLNGGGLSKCLSQRIVYPSQTLRALAVRKREGRLKDGDNRGMEGTNWWGGLELWKVHIEGATSRSQAAAKEKETRAPLGHPKATPGP